jgi:tRNA(Ile)-lysidine synthetase-like protein
MKAETVFRQFTKLGLESGHYLVAFSGGPDSVFLVESLCAYYGKDAGKRIVCAYVNYQDSPKVAEEESIVHATAARHGLRLCQKTVSSKGRKNFEAWARDIRYAFFADIARKEKADGVITAHQLSDSLETYLLQKERGNLPETYGLSPLSEVKGIPVLRPLLAFTKADILKDVEKNHYPYYEDATNFDMRHPRNRIRAKGISVSEARILQKEMAEKNRNVSLFNKKLSKLSTLIPFSFYDSLNEEEKKRIIFFLMTRSNRIVPTIQKRAGLAKDIYSFLKKKASGILPLSSVAAIYRTPDAFALEPSATKTNFRFVFRKKGVYKTPFFRIDLRDLSVFPKAAFPLTIRNAKEGDVMDSALPVTDVIRFLRKQHVPLFLLPYYPVFLRKGKIFYVPFYEDIQDKKIPLQLARILER